MLFVFWLGLPVYAAETNWIAAGQPSLNSDHSRQIVPRDNGFILRDAAGNVLGFLPAEINPACEPRWSSEAPQVLYFHSGNQLKSYDVSTGVTGTLRISRQNVWGTNTGVLVSEC